MKKHISLQEFYEGLDTVFQKKDINRTLEYMQNWQEKAEAWHDEQGIIAVCNELGGLCRAIGQTERAKQLYMRVLATLEELDLQESEHYATALLNTGDVYLNTGERSQALEYFQRSKKLLEKLQLQEDYRMAALCNNISMIYRETKEFAEAEQSLKTAFDIIKKLPQCRGELATTYVNLGELQVKQQKLADAEQSFLEAEKIFLQDTDGADVHYATACAGLGQVYYLTERFTDSKNYYEKALQLIERDYGKVPYYDVVAKNLRAVEQRMSSIAVPDGKKMDETEEKQ